LHTAGIAPAGSEFRRIIINSRGATTLDLGLQRQGRRFRQQSSHDAAKRLIRRGFPVEQAESSGWLTNALHTLSREDRFRRWKDGHA
jgi:hypothetical protein